MSFRKIKEQIDNYGFKYTKFFLPTGIVRQLDGSRIHCRKLLRHIESGLIPVEIDKRKEELDKAIEECDRITKEFQDRANKLEQLADLPPMNKELTSDNIGYQINDNELEVYEVDNRGRIQMDKKINIKKSKKKSDN